MYQRLLAAAVFAAGLIPASFSPAHAKNTNGIAPCAIICPENVNWGPAYPGEGGAYVEYPRAETSGDCDELTYDPPYDSFFSVGTTTVTVSSGDASCSFTVTVEPAPNSCPYYEGWGETYTDEDTPVAISLEIVDPDGDDVTSTIADLRQGATAVLQTDGSILYTPAPDYFGDDIFSVVLSDGECETTETVHIYVREVNDAPVGQPDSYQVKEDEALTVDAPGVLINDSDTEEQPLTAVVETEPSHGELVFNEDGSFEYTPSADFHGTDSFTYRAEDEENPTQDEAGPKLMAVSAPITVTLNVEAVNDCPTASEASVSTNEDTSVTIQLCRGLPAARAQACPQLYEQSRPLP